MTDLPSNADDSGAASAAAPGAILFTAFEPSGDAHAAPVVARLRELAPDRPIYAWGGARMAEAGAEVVEQTAGDGVIALPSAGRIRRFMGEMRRIETFAARNRVVLHIPVDSPAANTPLAKRLRASGSRVVNLVAPQYWAWGPWRRRKLQAITDLVLCLLPFEEAWFRERGIPAKFVGHPVINRSLDRPDLERRAAELPRGRPRLLILPGSRSKEIRSNLSFLLGAFSELQARHRGMSGIVAAASREIAEEIRRRHPSMPTGLHVINVGAGDGNAMLDASILWSDVALTVSGTVSLDVARQARPMVGIYRTGPLGVLVGNVMLTIPDRLLPNILAGERIVPEFVPYCGGVGKVVDAVESYLKDSRVAAETQASLKRVLSTFSGHDFAQESAEAILELLERGGR
ncbi:MAG: lipid-A-disaccharide synthase [Phycisphaerales bacterium]